MGFNGDNLKAIFDQRFGQGAFDSGVQQAYNNGRNQWLAQQQALQQQQYLDSLKQQQAKQAAQQKDPVYQQQNAQNYFTTNGTDRTKNSVLNDLLNKGAYQWVNDLKNDPMKQAELKKAGYNLSAIVDQAFNVASDSRYNNPAPISQEPSTDNKAYNDMHTAHITAPDGQFKSANAFKQYFQELDAQTKQMNKDLKANTGFSNQDTIQQVIDADKAKAAAAAQPPPKTGFWDDAGQALNALGQIIQHPSQYSEIMSNMFNNVGQTQVNPVQQELNRGAAHVANSMTLDALDQAYLKTNNGQQAPQFTPRQGVGKYADMGYDLLGSLVPYGATEKGISGINALTTLGEKGLAGKLASRAIIGGASGALVSGASQGMQAAINPQDFNLQNAAKDVGLNAAVGGVLDPLAHGVISMIKGLKAKGVTDPTEIQHALEQSGVPKEEAAKAVANDISNVLADQPKVMPNPIEKPLNIKSQPKATPQLKGNDWLNFAQQGSNKPIGRGLFLHDTTVSKGEAGRIKSLGEDTLNTVNKLQNAPSEGFNQRLLDVQKEMNGEHQSNVSTQKDFKAAVQQQYEYLKSSMGKGSEKGTTSNGLQGNFKEVTGTYNVSKNPGWYQDFLKVSGGRKPTDSELRKIAEDQVRNGFKDEHGNLPAWKPENLQHIHDQIDEIHSMLQEHPEQAHVLGPILKGLEEDEARITSSLNHTLNGKLPSVDELYSNTKGASDPKNFDELIKLAGMEHNAANPSLTSKLRSDPKIKQQLDKLNALGKPAKKSVKASDLKINLPEPKSNNPHDVLKNLKVNPSEPKGSDIPGEALIPKPKSGIPKTGDFLKQIEVQSKYVLNSIKTNKNVLAMTRDELGSTLDKLNKQMELVSKGGNAAKVKEVQEDIDKVQSLLKMDLQTFGEKTQKKTPEEVAKEKAIAKSRQDNVVKKYEDKANQNARIADKAAKKAEETKGKEKAKAEARVESAKNAEAKYRNKTESAKDLENSDNWKNKGSFSMGRETATRVFEDTMGKDAPKMIKKYIDPIKSEEANRVRFLNDERGKVKELGIKPGSKDDELVQKYGEKKITLDELKQQAPKTWEKIVAAEKHYRGFYDNILDVANKVLKANGFPEIPKRQDYFPHFQEIDGVMHQLGFDMVNHNLPTDINGLTENFRPQKSWFSNALRRTGEETDYGAAQGFDKYIEGISNVIYHTQNIKGLRALEEAVRAKYKAPETHLNNFVSWLREYTDQLAGKKSGFDRGAEKLFGRKIFGVLDKIRSKTGMNMVGANVGSALTNFIPLTQSLATTSKTAFTKGLTETVASLGKDDGFAAKSDFLTKREGSEPLYKTWSDKVTKKSMWLMSALDKFTSNVVVRSKYNEGIAKGLSEKEAMQQADEWANKLMAGRAKGDMPTIMNSKVLGLFTQFQLEVNNQVSFLLKDIPHNAKDKWQLASQIGQVMLYGYLFNNLYQQATGRRPAIDPIGITEQAWKDYHNDRLKQGTATSNLISNIAGQVPMGTQAAQALGLTPNTSRVPAPFMSALPNVANVLSGKSTWSKELENPLTYLLLPAGGNSIKKAAEGLTAYNKGGVYNGKGQLQYPVEQNAANAARAALFGKSSFPEAQTYYNNNDSALSDKQTKMVESGARSYQSILQERHNSDIMKKIKEIQKGPDSPAAKAQKITSLMARIKH